MPQVILTGFVATGKTEVGRRVARTLGRPFVDTDGLIEAEAGRTTAEIFDTEGEAGFRAREREAVARACGVPDAVVAAGDGALRDPESRWRLAAAGPIVCLVAEAEEIRRRIGDPRRHPLLLVNGIKSVSVVGRIRELLAERAPSYALATHTVDTTGIGVDEVVERVRALVGGR